MFKLLQSIWNNRQTWKTELHKKGELSNAFVLVAAAGLVIIIAIVLIAKFAGNANDTAGGIKGLFKFGTK